MISSRTLRILYKDIPIRDLAYYTNVIHTYCEANGFSIEMGGAEYSSEPPYLFIDFYPAEDASMFLLKGGIEAVNHMATNLGGYVYTPYIPLCVSSQPAITIGNP